KQLGDVYAGERVTHAVMGILYGAMAANLIPVLARWWTLPTTLAVDWAAIPTVLGWALFAMAAGVFVSGVRDPYAALELPHGGRPRREDARSGRHDLVDPQRRVATVRVRAVRLQRCDLVDPVLAVFARRVGCRSCFRLKAEATVLVKIFMAPRSGGSRTCKGIHGSAFRRKSYCKGIRGFRFRRKGSHDGRS